MAASKDRFEDLIHSIDAVVWEADAQTWQFTFVSRKAEELLGYPPEEWLEDPHFWEQRLVYPEDRERAARTCREAVEKGREHDIEYRVVTADGRVIWVHDRVRAVPPGPDGPPLLRGVMTDITAAKHLEGALREKEERLSRLTETSPDAIITIDEQSTVKFLNPAAEALFGYSSSELVGESLLKVIPQRFQEAHLQGMSRYVAAGEHKLAKRSMELVGCTREGAEIPLEIAFLERAQ